MPNCLPIYINPRLTSSITQIPILHHTFVILRNHAHHLLPIVQRFLGSLYKGVEEKKKKKKKKKRKKRRKKNPFTFCTNSDHVDFSQGVFLNGAIHWPSYTGETSVSFQVENECFKVLSMPPIQGGQLRRIIRFFGEAGGHLLLIDFHEPVMKNFDVFVLEDNSKWSVRQHVDLYGYRIHKFHILSVICEGDKDNLSLVIYFPGRDKVGKGLMIYNFKERRMRKLHPPVPTWDLRLFEEEGFLAVHPLIKGRFAV